MAKGTTRSGSSLFGRRLSSSLVACELFFLEFVDLLGIEVGSKPPNKNERFPLVLDWIRVKATCGS